MAQTNSSRGRLMRIKLDHLLFRLGASLLVIGVGVSRAVVAVSLTHLLSRLLS